MFKSKRTIESLPVTAKGLVERHENGLEEYCRDVLGLVNPSVRMKKIKLQSLVKKDGYYCYISGRTGRQLILRNAVNLCLELKWNRYINKILEFNQTGRSSSILSAEENILLYRALEDKHRNSIFSKRPNPVGEKLSKHVDDFSNLDFTKQCKTLEQILMLTIIGNAKADLREIDESPNTGVMLMNKDITKAERVLLINQSVTGVIESVTDLKTV